MPSKEETAPETEATQGEAALESGTYEILKGRLEKQSGELKKRLAQLNGARKEVFGAIENTLLGSERILTDHNCVPRDMVAIGERFIFGYNVHMGLKTSVELNDVFSVYEYREKKFQKLSMELLETPKFVGEFQDLYKFYKKTRFVKFTVLGPYLYMVFRVGRHVGDIKTFKWHIEGDRIVYVDARSDHEVVFPPQQEFTWKKATRDDHRPGVHPHISIMERVFVETVGGDLTIKVEDNTDSGKGIYAEEVENKDQNLDDAEVYYTALGNIILIKIRPFQEPAYRYFIFNEKMQRVLRLDTIEHACILLPDNQGLIFPNGYYLQSGEYKTFDLDLGDMVFAQRLASSNGEDYLYTFYNRESGVYLLLSYNIIAHSVETPVVCNGYSHFETGEMVLFKAEEEPRKNHVLQVWQTPFVGKNFVSETESDSLLFKIGNKEIVRCMAECQAVVNLIGKDESYASLYVDIAKSALNILDSYFWLDKPQAFTIRDTVQEIRETASLTVAEFEKVVRIRKATNEQIGDVSERTDKLIKEITYSTFSEIAQYVNALSELRVLRGEIISLKELRYCDLTRVDGMEARVKEQGEILSGKCVEFLLMPKGLDPYKLRVEEQSAAIDEVDRSARGKELQGELAITARDLDMLIEIVSNLKIDDPTQSTKIIDTISTIYSSVNQAKSRLHNRLKELQSVEGTAEFNSQIKLLNQSTVNFLDVADSPDKCDEFLTRLMVQVEELEGKFADFDDFLPQLAEKREQLFEAFESRKLALMEKRNKKGASLFAAAERIMKGVHNALKRFKTISEINGYFASNVMVEKVRDIADQLKALGDSVKADEVDSQLKSVREEAVRQLKDRQELFVDGENVIRFGNHAFSVNTHQLDLSVVQKEGGLFFHLTGTDFWQAFDDPEIASLKDVWELATTAESPTVYRAEYLAYLLLNEIPQGETLTDEALMERVREFMAPRYQEGYTKGVHDEDAAKILKRLMHMRATLDLLTYSPVARAFAALYWDRAEDSAGKERIAGRLKNLHRISAVFDGGAALDAFTQTVADHMAAFHERYPLFPAHQVNAAAAYLCREIMRGDTFIISSEARELYSGFMACVQEKGGERHFKESLMSLEDDLSGAMVLVREWLAAWESTLPNPADPAFLEETAVLLLLGSFNEERVIKTRCAEQVEGLLGDHPVIVDRTLTIAYAPFMERLGHHNEVVVPRVRRFQERKKELTDGFRTKLRLNEFKPRVLSSFVRNKLIDKVYLPLIGDNLAKQIGVVGAGKRTDLMGMLLLISPPGYGKTTLMEYIASRLGIIFMKINGPAIGHRVTSLDPADADNAAAKEELTKLNLSFEMGNNVMIYVDDIQHCNPEFLQKFISLCDGQRKIEGVYQGVSKTYDMRGKKVAVVMAGNPYTESGEKFQIPDMLANRSDVYNLGDMLRENEGAFKLSYIENALTSNPVLNKLISKSPKDVYALIEAAETGEHDTLELQGGYAVEEITEFIEVLKKLLRVRDVVLDVNMEYIRSAAMADEYRTEPAFKLQGSYRNMNKIAEKVLPVMNDAELESLILGSYENDSQTLTSGAEANILKWKELAGVLSGEDSVRWDEMKQLFARSKLASADNTGGQVVLQLSDLKESLATIQKVLSFAFSPDRLKED